MTQMAIRHPWLVIVVMLLITVLFALQLPKTQLDNDVFTFVPDDHPDNVAMDEVEEVFGITVPMSVGIEFLRGSIFDPDSVALVRELTQTFEGLENVGDVTSMTNIDYIVGDRDGMQVTNLFSDFNGSSQDAREAKERLLSWEMYRNFLYSDDFRSTQILIGVDLDLDADAREALYFAVKDVLATKRSPGVNFYVAGEPVISVLLSTNMRGDLATLIPLVVVVVLVVLLLFFRRLGGVILPTLAVVISSIWTVGAMAFLGISLSLVATVIPVLLVAVGSAYGIHVVNHYYRSLDAGRGALTSEENIRAIEDTRLHVGKPVLLAGVTTIIGFGALTTSEVGPMRSFGIFTACGVAVALAVALTVIPALLVLLPGKRRAPMGGHGGATDATLHLLAGVVREARYGVLVLTAIVAATAAWGASKLVVDNELIAYFAEDTEVKVSDRFLRDRFGGTRTFDIEVSGDEAESLTRPEILLAMDRLESYLEERYPERVARVAGYTTFIKRMNQVMHVGEPPPHQPAAAPSSEEIPRPDAGTPAPDTPAAHTPAPNTPSADGNAAGGSVPSFFSDSGFLDASEESAETGESAPQETAPATTTAVTDIAAVINRAYSRTAKAELSASELVELINRETNYRGASYYEIPSEPGAYGLSSQEDMANLISQYLLVYSGSLEDWANDALEPSKARMLVQLGTSGNIFTDELVQEIDSFVMEEFPPGYRVRSAGFSIVEMAITRLISRAQVLSIVVSLTLVFFIIALTYRSITAGLIGIVPLGFTVLVNFGVMGLSGINLDVSTAMVASIAIGIGIDYTIHFLSAYHRESTNAAGNNEPSRGALETTGKAILFNAGSVAAGFAVLLLSNFVPLRYLGLLIALTMFTSSIASMTILPVFLDVVKPRFLNHTIRKEKSPL